MKVRKKAKELSHHLHQSQEMETQEEKLKKVLFWGEGEEWGHAEWPGDIMSLS